MGLIGLNCHNTLCNIPEEHRSHLLHDGKLESCTVSDLYLNPFAATVVTRHVKLSFKFMTLEICSPFSSTTVSILHTYISYLPLVIANLGIHSGTICRGLHCKPEDYGFNTQCGHWDFSLTKSFRPHFGPGVN
jgi:hypothetical protein